jgi:hypothetical protein
MQRGYSVQRVGEGAERCRPLSCIWLRPVDIRSLNCLSEPVEPGMGVSDPEVIDYD